MDKLTLLIQGQITGMNKKQLFEYLREQEPEKLVELLDRAFDTMNTNQRHDVFGRITIEIPPAHVDGEKLLSDIEQFKKHSLAGYYYAPFDINSKNFSHVPEETDEWFDKIGDYLEDSSRLTDQGDHELAVQCFKILHGLIDKMEDGDEIVFADEYGTWMITGDEKRFVKSFLTSLSTVSNTDDYVAGAIPLIKRDSYESFHNKVYSTALAMATGDQKKLLKREVKKQGIRTSRR